MRAFFVLIFWEGNESGGRFLCVARRRCWRKRATLPIFIFCLVFFWWNHLSSKKKNTIAAAAALLLLNLFRLTSDMIHLFFFSPDGGGARIQIRKSRYDDMSYYNKQHSRVSQNIIVYYYHYHTAIWENIVKVCWSINIIFSRAAIYYYSRAVSKWILPFAPFINTIRSWLPVAHCYSKLPKWTNRVVLNMAGILFSKIMLV